MKKEYQSVEAEHVPKAPASVGGESLARFALTTGFLMAILLIVGLVIDKQRVALAFICGTAFFTLFGGGVIALLSGQLTSMVAVWQVQKTVRLQELTQLQMAQTMAPAPPTIEVVRPLELPAPEKALPNFVSAVPQVSEVVKADSYSFVYKLYKDGKLDPERVLGENTKAPGKIQLKKERPEVMEYLKALRIVIEDESTRMIYYNAKEYPTWLDCRLAIRIGKPRDAQEEP